jgi:hypothetical protein
MEERSVRRRWHDVHTSPLAIERHNAVQQSVERVVGPLADAAARMKAITDLANENIACANLLPGEPLDAAALGLRIATVAAGTLPFFVCHESAN